MNFLLTISTRNLFRQRRRSILLGTAIAFGTAILVLANAFAHGISEVLFNEIVSYVAGHVSVSFIKGGNPNNQVFHDGERMRKIVQERVPEMVRAEEAIGTFTRAIGNGKADNIIMIGLDPSGEISDEELKKVEKNFKVIEGTFDAVRDTMVENPVGISLEKAKSLNVKMHDIIRVRFQDLYGRTQAARLTVAFIFKPSNVFMSAPVFVHIRNLKRMLGYGPHDIAQLYLTIKNPKKNAKRLADSLYAGLAPPLAVIDGSIRCEDSLAGATICALRTDSVFLAGAASALKLVSRISQDTVLNKRTVVISSLLASKLGVKPGDTCYSTYKGKFDGKKSTVRFTVTAIADTGCGIDGEIVLLNENEFYKAYYDNWPESSVDKNGPFRPDSSIGIYQSLGGEWLLVDRSKTTDDVIKKYRKIAQKGWKAIVVDVGSMYETASMVLNVEKALNLITFVCVMLLFFIILIGVINTLRMTIRERTREIGTVRAIGMQRADVRSSFLIETGLLALISSIAGTILAFAGMWGLSQLTFKADDNPISMILVDGHLFFAPTAGAVLFFVVLIVGIAVLTAWFPARRAARLSAAEALRHFE
jgi:ABC-type lipoprotein release transport system permease subunit